MTGTASTQLMLLTHAMAQHPTDVYAQMDAWRALLNQQYFTPPNATFECYLEDAWNESDDGVLHPGETHFEYRIRSLITKNEIGPLGIDVYTNHQDDKGVWHLGDYQHSFWLVTPAATAIPVKYAGYQPVPIQQVDAFLRDNA
jgi:hypothetical protein